MHARAAQLGGLALALCAFFGGSARAGSVAAPQTPQQLEETIARLSADEWRDRRDAMQALIDAGPSAEFRLERLVAETHSPEARIRALRVLRQIRPLRRVAPALITLDLRGVSAKAAFQNLADVEGAELPAQPPDLLDSIGGTVTARFDARPYWAAVLELCRQGGLGLRFRDGAVFLARQRDGDAAVVSVGASGPFLVCGGLTRASTVAREPALSLHLELYAEPRASLIYADPHVTLTRAVDQHGQSLLPASDAVAGTHDEGLANAHRWSIPLSADASSDAVLARVEGTASAVLAERLETVELPDHPDGKTLAGPMPVNISAGAVSAALLRVVQTGDGWRMDVQLSTDPAEVDWQALTNSMGNGRLRVFDVNGRELVLHDLSCPGAGPTDNVQCNWIAPRDPSLPRPGAPFKLIWQVPARTVRVDVPFELRDVKLNEGPQDGAGRLPGR